MVARRVALPPPIYYSARSSLDATKHTEVNAILKQLKACAKRLQTAFASHALELQVLERLYYKGKNQHRPALFWRHVAEMRRYGERLEGMRIHEQVQSLWTSFWGEAASQNVKLTRGPWTHHPDPKSVLSAVKRSYDGCQLLEKMQASLISAYHSFTLVMQTAAFLQLVVTLAAIASRLGLLATEICSCLQLTRITCHRLLQVLDSEQAQKASRYIPQDDVRESVDLSNSDKTRDIPEETYLIVSNHDAATGEDMGSVLARPVASPTDDAPTTPAFEDISLHLAPTLQADLRAVSTSIVTTVRSTVASNDGAVGNHDRSSTSAKRKGATDAQEKKSKKKKKRRDEIDDIFGL